MHSSLRQLHEALNVDVHQVLHSCAGQPVQVVDFTIEGVVACKPCILTYIVSDLTLTISPCYINAEQYLTLSEYSSG